MLRRAIALLALAMITAPTGALGQDREWEEDYTDQGREEAPPPPTGDYDVSVDLNDQGSVSFESFQGSLSPYGDWVEVGSYGRAWRPRVAAGWRPYYYGRWEWTNEGWLWVSDEPFGWATYHYGRWTFDSYYGWVWVPGYQWAPAWVAWRYSGEVVGWAPLGPGVSVYVSNYPFVDLWWTFVPTARFVAVPVYSVAYAPIYTRRYFYATAPAPPRVVATRPGMGRPVPSPAWGGPAPRVIEQRIGRPVTPMRIVPAPSPGVARPAGPGEVAIYRPERPSPARASESGRGPATAPAPAPAPGRPNVAQPPPGRSTPGGSQPEPSRPAPSHEAPSHEAPGRPAPSRGSAPPRGRGGEGAWGPGAMPSRGGGYGFAPPPRERAAPVRTEGGMGGGYAPPGRGGGYGGGSAPAPRAEHGGGGGAPRAEHGGGGGGGRAAPHHADHEHR